MNNLDYFRLAIANKEGLIDPNYHKFMEQNVIPKTKEEENDLTISNNKVIRYISTIQTLLNECKCSIDDSQVVDILKLIIGELKTKGMNFSAFCQYFNVHNMNYSIFENLSYREQIEVLKYIIKPYIETRHSVYLSHGYSNIVLQVMSDNYSHKKKGTYGTRKIAEFLNSIGIYDLMLTSDKNIYRESYYLLSDKNGKKKFKSIANFFGIKLKAEGKNTEKYPDAYIKIGNSYFIVEQKNMKENGGGQDKQTLEITDFIDREPEFENLHYITYINGIYFNQINENAFAKNYDQYHDILSVLTKHKNNYFVNSFAFEQLINDTLANEKQKCANVE